MIQYLAESEKKDCRSLWEEAFPEDSLDFCDYYFQEKTKDNRILVRKEAGVMQAMLHLNPYLLSVRGHHVNVNYIVGVATRTDCRRRGYMRELLIRTFSDLYEESMPFVYLMPAAREIYEPYDFVHIFDQPVWKLKEPDQLTSQVVIPAGELEYGKPVLVSAQSQSKKVCNQRDGFGWRKRLEEVADWIDGWLRQRYQVYAVRNRAYLEQLGKELLSEQGRMELLYDGSRMVGVRAEWGTQKREQRFLYCESGYCELLDCKPSIMARIINLSSFVKPIRLRKNCREEEARLILEIEDPWIADNNGLWSWNLTKQMSWVEPLNRGSLEAAELGAGNEEILKLSIRELTGWLFGYEVPDAAQPYQERIEPLQEVFLDEIV